MPQVGYWSGREFIRDLITRDRCALPTPGLVIRSEALELERFDESLPGNRGDFPIFMRLPERGEVAVSNDRHFSPRVHGGNASNIPFSAAIPERTRIFGEYVDEYRVRYPDDFGFVQGLHRSNERNHWKGLLWGWLTACKAADAERYRVLLRDSVGRFPLAGLLKFLGRAGVSLERRRSVVQVMRGFSQPVKRAH